MPRGLLTIPVENPVEKTRESAGFSRESEHSSGLHHRSAAATIPSLQSHRDAGPISTLWLGVPVAYIPELTTADYTYWDIEVGRAGDGTPCVNPNTPDRHLENRCCRRPSRLRAGTAAQGGVGG